jgi:type VI secretion system protein VasD
MHGTPRRRTFGLALGALFRSVVFAGPALLAGCGPAAPPPPTVVYVKLVATNDVNGSAPVAVRVYQLASKSGFEGAEFFPLYKSDAAALGPDLIKKDEVLLAPGTTKVLTLSPTDPVKAIGIFAAYGKYQTATWRGDADVPAHETTTVTATIGASAVKVTAVPGKPAGS